MQNLTENHANNDYFTLLRKMIEDEKKNDIEVVYEKILQEIIENSAEPVNPVKFGTSGWRGILGKEITVKTVTQVTRAIIQLYENLDIDNTLTAALGVETSAEAKKRGCVLGFDNRFAGELLAIQVGRVLVEAGFTVYYAGETTTGVLSAVVQQKRLAFSINLTPSHNPFEYGGYKFNGGDAGPAPTEVTSRITEYALNIVKKERDYAAPLLWDMKKLSQNKYFYPIDSLAYWIDRVEAGKTQHGIGYNQTVQEICMRKDFCVVIDSVHGASRLHIKRFFGVADEDDLPETIFHLRNSADVTFGGIAPEPSTVNLRDTIELLRSRGEKLKLGAIIDPDGDRIRFTDGITEISMNQFGAMAYHFLHEYKKKKGPIAKTVATSNLANSLAKSFGEEIFEPPVGFKNFKPVIGKALVFFEESDGISLIGHTPEKDAYIGLLLALSMMLETGMTLGEYLQKIEKEYGVYIPERDGIVVVAKGKELEEKLSGLACFTVGEMIKVGKEDKRISEIITIDGCKMIFDDGSWLMIRPSGTEPKVRFYVESRTKEGTKDLVAAAKEMLKKVGVI